MTYPHTVCSCGASGSGQVSEFIPIRRRGQFLAAGKQKTVRVGLNELTPIKNTDIGPL